MAKKLYFIENIRTILPERNEASRTILTMEDVTSSEELGLREFYHEGHRNEGIDIYEVHTPFISPYMDELVMMNFKSAIHEGQYVYYDSEIGEFEPAYKDPLSISRRNDNIRLRTSLIELIGRNEPEANRVASRFSNNVQVISYHVNVGHGNCTIILIRDGKESELWMVDCGGIDIINGQCYYSNISACLVDIASKYKIPQEDFYISKFFLTHWHYDHISGLLWLIRQGLIDARTQCYMNLYYGHSSKCANEVLRELYRLRVKCYEPTATLKTIQEVAILHPECRIRKWATPKDENYRIVTKMNNTSVVYSISIGRKTMVFPGDLEKTGWDAMTSAATCQKRHLCTTNYYCVSHHGSMTGHVDIPCLERNHYPKVGNCIKAGPLQKAILMGRDGAYPGIYNNGVVNYWGNILRYSEHDDQNNSRCAYVLEWDSNKERYL